MSLYDISEVEANEFEVQDVYPQLEFLKRSAGSHLQNIAHNKDDQAPRSQC